MFVYRRLFMAIKRKSRTSFYTDCVFRRFYHRENCGDFNIQCKTLKEIINQTDESKMISQTDEYLVSLSSKTYVFEDKMTKY